MKTDTPMITEENVKIGSFVSVQMGLIVNVLSKAESLCAQNAWSKNTKKKFKTYLIHHPLKIFPLYSLLFLCTSHYTAQLKDF